MRPARCFIHLLRCHLPELHACVYNVHSLLHSFDRDFNQVFHEDLTVILLTNLEILPFVRVKQVLDLVLINLVEAEVHFPFENDALLLLMSQNVDDLVHRLRDNTDAGGIDVV